MVFNTSTNSSNPLNTGKPLLFAHRGSSILAPENTFVAFDLGEKYKADVLEIDVRYSRDKHIMVIHDAHVDRTTNGSGKVISHKLQDLKKLNAGYRFNCSQRGSLYRNANIEIPTLLELYEAYPRMLVNIDIKDNLRAAAKALVKVIEKAGAEERTIVASFHSRVLNYFRQIAPHIATSATFNDVLALYISGKLYKNKAMVSRPIALQIPTHYKMLRLDTQRFIRKAHRHHTLVNYWTVNNKDMMQRLLERGADGIVTDRPDLALPIYKALGYK